MRIALVISSLNSGGAERVMSELANQWVNLGYEVSFFTLTSPDAKPFYSLNPKIKIHNLNQIRYTYYRRIFSFITRVFVLRKALKKFKPTVIISFIDIMNLTTLLASFKLSIPIIISERTDPTYHYIPSFCKFLRIRIYSQAKFLVVQTKNASDFFPESFKKFTRIIPNPVGQTILTKKNTHLPVKHLISVGRLDSLKDHKTLILAFADLIFVHKMDLHLTIYGEGLERKILENLIDTLGLQKKISLPGVVADIYQVLYLGDIFIFPSLYEGFPNALCEAMSVGLPVIASRCSGNTDVIREEIDGLLFPIRDVQALVSKIIFLIENKSKREFFSKNALSVVERFNSKSVFESWNQLISLALDSKTKRKLS